MRVYTPFNKDYAGSSSSMRIFKDGWGYYPSSQQVWLLRGSNKVLTDFTHFTSIGWLVYGKVGVGI